MVLETTGNANRFLRLGTPSPLHWWSPLCSLSTSPLWCYSRSEVGCIVLRLCWVKVLRPGCVLPPSLLFQPFVLHRQYLCILERDGMDGAVGVYCMCFETSDIDVVELRLLCSPNLAFSERSVSPTCVASHSLQLILYTGPTTLSFPTWSFRWTSSWRRVFVGLKYVGIPYPPKVLFNSNTIQRWCHTEEGCRDSRKLRKLSKHFYLVIMVKNICMYT